MLKGAVKKTTNLLVSHYPGLVRSRREVISELEERYALRTPDIAEILIRR